MIYSDFVKGGDIDRLDEVLEFGDSLLEEVGADLVVLDDAADLQLLDTVGEWHQLRGAPQQTVGDDRSHGLLDLGHIGLVVPWLHIEDDVRLGDDNGLGRLLLVVHLDALFLDSLLLVVFLIVGTEQIKFIVISFWLLGCLDIVHLFDWGGDLQAEFDLLQPTVDGSDD